MVELCASLIGALSEVRLGKVADHFFSVRPIPPCSPLQRRQCPAMKLCTKLTACGGIIPSP